jgi:hypothetical protein
MKYQKSAVALALVLTFSVLIAALGQSAIKAPDKLETDLQTKQVQTELQTIARSALEAEKTVLIRGEAARDNRAIAQTYRDFLQDRQTDIIGRRNALAARQVIYTDFKTDLKVTNIQTGRSSATLWAIEHTSLALKAAEGPPTTEYEQEHRFDFVYQEGQWKLIKDQLLNPGGAYQPKGDDMPIFATPTQTDPARTPVSKEPESDLMIQQATSGLNRQAIADYARRYCFNYNSAYRADGNDCTNFASQCLYAGGSPMITGWYQSNSVWWYNFSAWFSPYHSYAWGGAHNFYTFLASRPRGTLAQNTNQLQIGDILQADWDSTNGRHVPDGYIDHTMVVTGKSSNGEIFLTYHSNNVRDRSMTDLRRAEPRANFYGWRLYAYPN